MQEIQEPKRIWRRNVKKEDEDTTSGKLATIKRKQKNNWNQEGMLDAYIASICLEHTVGETLSMMETAHNARTCWAATLISRAIYDRDMGAISQIVTRIDGTVPESKERSSFAKIMGDALNDVLDYTDIEEMTIFPDDPVIIALAKVVIWISVSEPGNNFSKKKEKQQAIEMVLQRTGGRKSEPTRNLLDTKFVEPDWMRGLTDGN